MANFATLSLGPDVSTEDSAAILEELLELASVKSARALEPRAIDPGSIMLMIEILGGALGVATSAWAFIEQIRTSLKRKKVTGATITLPNGTKIELDSVSEEQVAHLISDANG